VWAILIDELFCELLEGAQHHYEQGFVLTTRRTLLFLQGPTSVFWRELGSAFSANGHRVLKINCNFGEQWYWRQLSAWNYRGRFRNWRHYLHRFMTTQHVTDVIYYADRLPYHVVAADVARELGVRTFVVENGYLRPDWITLERGGMSAYSHFPSDPGKIRQIAAQAAEPDLTDRYLHRPFTEDFHEANYHNVEFLFRTHFPFYRPDRDTNTFVNIASGLRRRFRRKELDRRADAVIGQLIAGKLPFFLVAMQTQGDYQIRDNSPYTGIGDMIEEVAVSFAAHASPSHKLVFKLHPHDNAVVNWRQTIAEAAARHGINGRVETIDGGDLVTLFAIANGVVTVNSTVGLRAIRNGCPVKCLGAAIYDVPGLTHQGGLDTFWSHPAAIDRGMADAFVRAINGTIQIKGSFYHPAGRQAAIAEIVKRIENDVVNQPDAYEETPPRLQLMASWATRR
jgi:capsular polysaccharide export protein